MQSMFLKNVSLQAVCLSILFGAVACREEEVPGSDASDMSPDVQDDMTPNSQDAASDMVEDLTSQDMAPDLPDDMGCEAMDVCAPGVCGMQNNDCGEEVDCGECACADGVPSTPFCGPCGLGETTCEEPDSSAASCSLGMDELPLVSAQCVEVRFVSPSTLMEGDGSRERPYNSIQKALDELEATGGLVVLQAGEHTLPERLVLKEGVHILGGANSEFLHDEEGMSSIRVTPTGTDGDLVGVLALELSNKTWLKQIDIYTENVDAGHNLYAMHVMASPGLHLEEVNVHGGKVADGANGKTGSDGTDSLPGEDAEERVTLAKRVGDMTQNGYENGAFAGTGGQNADCRDRANGGSGGEGFHVLAIDPPGDPVQVVYTLIPGEAGGVNAVGLPGGVAGSEASPNGQDGQPGATGMTGQSGASGTAQGSLVRGFWQVQASGIAGQDGQHGTGGSGGGGSYWMTLRNPVSDSDPGASGGGGGAGGCGGQGGGAGEGGGSAFGLLLVDSSGVVLDRVTVQGPDAGNGGNAGDGGRGGKGASGGLGSSLYAVTATTSSTRPHTRAAGRGGTGDQGGDGGQGGAGAGGSAFGIYCSNTTVERIEPVMVSSGLAGSGGMGLPAGEDGQQQHVFGCW